MWQATVALLALGLRYEYSHLRARRLVIVIFFRDVALNL